MPLNNIELGAIISWFNQRTIPFDESTIYKFSNYHDLLISWSYRINLVSSNDLEKIVENHFLDSLGPIEMIPSLGNLIDIGSGAGLPGIPLAIVLPELNITLIESTHKRVLFLRDLKKQLALDNIIIREGRFEKMQDLGLFDIATIRALPDWRSYLPKLKSILKPDGKIIYYKYRGVYEEIK